MSGNGDGHNGSVHSLGNPLLIATAPAEPQPLTILDTTLRDGEQSPGVALIADDKLAIARQLARLRVDVIEAASRSRPRVTTRRCTPSPNRWKARSSRA